MLIDGVVSFISSKTDIYFYLCFYLKFYVKTNGLYNLFFVMFNFLVELFKFN